MPRATTSMGYIAYGANSTFPNTTSVTGDNFWVDVRV